ncbi:hypothetical protein Tco_1156936 [Tanacetum coccineum]
MGRNSRARSNGESAAGGGVMCRTSRSWRSRGALDRGWGGHDDDALLGAASGMFLMAATRNFALMGLILHLRFVKAVGMHAVPSPITGTFMPPSNKPTRLDDTHIVSKTADQKPSSTIDDPSFSVRNVKTPRYIATYVPAGSRNPPAYVPAGSAFPADCRNRPTSVPASSAFRTGSRNRPASVSAGRPFSARWRNHVARPMTRPTSHYFQHFRRPGCYNQLYMDEGRWGTTVQKTSAVVLEN